MDPAGIITGAVVALLAATVIPFITEQWSLWSKRRGQIVTARRTALDQYVETLGRVEMEALEKDPTAGTESERYVGNNIELEAAYARLKAQFSLRDDDVFNLWMKFGSKKHDVRLVLASWANGENRRARKAAKRLLIEVERQKNAERHPEAHTSEQPNKQTDQ